MFKTATLSVFLVESFGTAYLLDNTFGWYLFNQEAYSSTKRRIIQP